MTQGNSLNYPILNATYPGFVHDISAPIERHVDEFICIIVPNSNFQFWWQDIRFEIAIFLNLYFTKDWSKIKLSGCHLFYSYCLCYCSNFEFLILVRRLAVHGKVHLQFPIWLAFAITINKSQSQTFDKVCLFVKDENAIFLHGQLYVALSQCRSKAGIKIESTLNHIKNIVFKEIFNLKLFHFLKWRLRFFK